MVSGCREPYSVHRNELEVLEYRPERDRGEERQCGDNEDGSILQGRNEERSMVGKVPALAGTIFFLTRFPAIAITGMMNRNRPTHMAPDSIRL